MICKSFTLLMLICISVREKCTVFVVTDRVVPKTRAAGHHSFNLQCIIQILQPVKTLHSVLFCCAGKVAYGWSD